MTTDPSPAAPSATAAPVIPLAFAKRVGGPWWRIPGKSEDEWLAAKEAEVTQANKAAA